MSLFVLGPILTTDNTPALHIFAKKKKKTPTEQMTNLATQTTPAPGCNIEPLAADAAVLLSVESEAQTEMEPQ